MSDNGNVTVSWDAIQEIIKAIDAELPSLSKQNGYNSAASCEYEHDDIADMPAISSALEDLRVLIDNATDEDSENE